MAFSNVPGLVKPLSLNKEGTKKSIKMAAYLVTSGHIGITLNVLSHVDTIGLSMTVDDAVLAEPRVLLDMLIDNVKKCYPT